MTNHNARPEDELIEKLLGDLNHTSSFDATIAGLEEIADKLALETRALHSFPNESFAQYRADLTTFLKSLPSGVRVAVLTALLFDEASRGDIGTTMTSIAVEKLVTTLDEKAAAATGIPVQDFLQASIERIVGHYAVVQRA